MTRAPCDFATCIASIPTVPTPMTATVWPDSTMPRRTACIATDPGSTSAASSLLTLSGSVMACDAGQTMYSASPPSSPNPATAIWSHWYLTPARHHQHSPQVSRVSSTTRWPTDGPETPSPSFSTVPVISCPVIIGVLLPVSGLGSSWKMNLGP